MDYSNADMLVSIVTVFVCDRFTESIQPISTQWNIRIQERVSATRQLLGSINEVKMTGREGIMVYLMQKLQAAELAAFRALNARRSIRFAFSKLYRWDQLTHNERKLRAL